MLKKEIYCLMNADEKIIEKKKFSCIKLLDYYNNQEKADDIFEGYDIETLELLAIELYNISFGHISRSQMIPRDLIVDILDDILSQRCIKLNSNHVWSNENVQEIVRVSEMFASASEKAFMYAESIANDLGPKKTKNEFLMEYEIEVKLNPYLKGYKTSENSIDYFMFVLCEPLNKYLLTCDYSDNKYFDRTDSWNGEPFWDENYKPLNCFKDKYISYAIHELLDTHIWSFYDIMNIDKICVEVKVIHKSFMGDYSKYDNE